MMKDHGEMAGFTVDEPMSLRPHYRGRSRTRPGSWARCAGVSSPRLRNSSETTAPPWE
jgi:hypothetical protein